jgi:hypothetical protein
VPQGQDPETLAIPDLGDDKPIDFVRAFATKSESLQMHMKIQLLHSKHGVYDPQDLDVGKCYEETHSSRKIMEHVAPRDILETMLVTQMVAVHNMAMHCTFMANVKNQGYATQQEAINQTIKLTRTYASQLQSLKSYRSEPKKTSIGTVNVNDNAQAVVGDVSTSGGNNAKNSG